MFVQIKKFPLVATFSTNNSFKIKKCNTKRSSKSSKELEVFHNFTKKSFLFELEPKILSVSYGQTAAVNHRNS